MSHEWTLLYGTRYDLRPLLDIHPGGDILRLAFARDGTTLFESYHPGYKMPHVHRILRSLPILPPLPHTPDEDTRLIDTQGEAFFVAVRNRVEQFLSQKGFSRVEYQYSYLVETYFTLTLYWIAALKGAIDGSYEWASLCGLCIARLGFIMHTGNHCAASTFPWINQALGRLINWIGGNDVVWKHEHQIAHHISPNHLGHDNDCEIGYPLLRLHPHLPHRWWHRFQPVVLQLGITLGLLKWSLSDGWFLFSKQVGHIPIVSLRWSDILRFIISKAIWWMVHFIAPIYFHGWSIGIGTALVKFGLAAHYLEQIFLVSHIQEPLFLDRTHHWSIQQVEHTSNWSSGSVVATWISGGLNHQIEHHLFPQLHPYLYPHIASVVREVCHEYHVRYYTFPSFVSAWWNMMGYVCKNGWNSSWIRKRWTR